MTRKFISYCLFLLALLHFSIATKAQEDHTERIISFHSDIRIDTSGLIKITERIKVYSDQDQIKRGIMRSIPLTRKDKYGNTQKIDFQILNVSKDGKKEKFFTEETPSKRIIYIGDKNELLSNGTYQYEISYQTKGHVGFFDGYDELYWNVTGNQWDFRIDSASATIHVPAGATVGNTSCYTGTTGSKAQDCHIQNNADGSVTFTSNGMLHQNEGLTVAAAFTSGIIKQPTFAQKLTTEYKYFFIPLLLLILLGGYYYYTWNKYGRDPKSPLVIPTFNVPGNFSPAVLRYLYKKSIDPKAFAISVINMAVKKVIKISKGPDKKDDYVLTRLTEKTDELSSEEQQVYKKLLGYKKTIKVDVANGSYFYRATTAHSAKIKEQITLKNYFLSNNKQLVYASLITIAAIVIYMIFVDAPHPGILLFATPFLTGGIFCIYIGVRNLLNSYGLTIFLIAFGAAFAGMPAYLIFTELHNFPTSTIIFMICIVAMFTTYVFLIKAPTTEGAVLTSEIEGFKMYLETAEQHRLNLLNPPDMTPQLFEKFLPYAMALDVENEWGAKFESILNSVDYQPDWYDGTHFPYRTIGAVLAQPFSQALKESRPASQSTGSSSGSSGSSSWSSGSSGGGSSGGGGGGGGGGGW